MDFIALVCRHRGTNTAIEALRTPDPTMKAYVDYHVASNGEKRAGGAAFATQNHLRVSLYGHLSFVGKLRACMELNSKRDF